MTHAAPISAPGLRTPGSHNSWIDVVRGLAILGVVTVHSSQHVRDVMLANNVMYNPALEALMSYGQYGVEVFYFISGWLLGSIYGSSGSLQGTGYWRKRLARIYPLWMLFLAIMVVRGYLFPASPGNWTAVFQLQEAHGGSWVVPVLAVLGTLTFTLFFSPELWNSIIVGGWSIQSEMAHYALFPLIRRIRLPIALAVLIIVNLLTIVGTHATEHGSGVAVDLFDSWKRLGIFSTFAFFLLGMGAQYVARELTLKSPGDVITDLLARRGIWLVPVYAVTLLLVAPPFGDNVNALGVVIIAGLAGFALLALKPARVAFVTVGKYSYFIYFAHFLVLEAGESILSRFVTHSTPSGLGSVLGFIFLFALVWVIVVPVGALSFRFFESPFIRLARRRRTSNG